MRYVPRRSCCRSFRDDTLGAPCRSLTSFSPAPHPWLAASGLACDARGYALADSALALDAARTVFGGGDCVTLRDAPQTPKAGVYAVRMAPVLATNVMTAAFGAEHTPSPPLGLEFRA